MWKSLWFLFLVSVSWSALGSEQLCELGLSKKASLQAYNYIIIPGIVNEFVPYYMTEYRRFLMDEGVPSNQILRINNSSLYAPEKNVDKLITEVSSFKNDKPLVFLAHSKGALELLYALLKDKNIESKLERAFLIQGALDGSSIYRALIHEQRKNTFFGVGRWLAKIPFIKKYAESFGFPFVRSQLQNLPLRSNLLSRLVFVQSDAPLDKLSYKFRYVGGFYKDFYGSPGDGVLLKSDHIPFSLKDKNICKVFYEADHGDLVKAAPWQKGRVQKVRSFLSNLVFGLK